MEKITSLAHLQACAVAAKGFVSGLVAELAEAMTAAVSELAAAKADKGATVAVSIPAAGWQSDSGDYPYYYDIVAAGVTARDRAAVAIAPAGIDVAVACGLCPTNETMAGKIRVRAKSVPAAEIAAEFWLMQGKE